MKKLSILFLSVLTLGMAVVSCSKDDDMLNDVDSSSLVKDIHVCVDVPILKNANLLSSKVKGGILTNVKLATGQTVRVKFLNGDDFLKGKVKEFAGSWKAYANINFVFVESNENADIKIGFKWNNDGTSWSYMGNQCSFVSQNSPSMNFGWFNSSTTDTEFSRVVVHEFGHALGLIHEHQNPTANIQWNKPVVYAYYANQGWDAARVDSNIFFKYNTTVTNYSNYDGLSIMNYPIDASFTTNGYSVGSNTNLSPTDKIFMSNMYRYPSVLNSGMIFKFGDILKSPNGKYTLANYLVMLNLFDENNNNLWSSTPAPYGLFGKHYKYVYTMRSDGNLVATYYQNDISNPVVVTSWQSNTSGNPGAVLSLQNDGNLVISLNGITKWSSKYGKV